RHGRRRIRPLPPDGRCEALAGARLRAAPGRDRDHGGRSDGGRLREPAAARRPRDLAPGLMPALRAELLAIGSEPLGPLRSDTNTIWMTGRLLEIGVATTARITVADDASLLQSAFRHAIERAEVVIASGGLGPTEDDLTREAAAGALGRPLHRDPRY